MAVNPIASRYCCVTIQQMLQDIAGPNTPELVVQETNAFTNALMSGENSNGFEQVQTESRAGKARPVTGGNRRVEVAYRVRNCETSADVPTDICTPATEQGDDMLYSEVTVECYKEQKFNLSKEEFRQLCESPNDRLQTAIVDRVNNLKRDVNNDLIDKYIADLGNYYTAPGDVPVNSGVAPKTLAAFRATGDLSGAPIAYMMSPLMSDYRRSGFSGRPIVVGDDLYARWRSLVGFRGNVEGADLAQASLPTAYFDYRLNSQFNDGEDHIISWTPGAVQMLEWFQFPEGTPYAEMKEDYQQTIMEMDGFEFDFEVRYNECNGGSWTIKLSKYYDLFKIPEEAKNADCGLGGYCLNWLLDCLDVDCNYHKL